MQKSQSKTKYLYDIIGTVSQINTPDKAEIEFELNNRVENALLRKDKFFYNGRRIPEKDHLSDYIIVGSKIIFSCHLLNTAEKNDWPLFWFIMISRNFEEHPDPGLKLKTGLVNCTGCVREIHKRHGVLYTDHSLEKQSAIYFLASKFYVDGKRLPSSRSLSEVLNINDIVFFDAIPCIPDENEDYCNWFAITVFKGKRPDIYKLTDNKTLESEEKGKKTSKDEEEKNCKKIVKNSQNQKPYIYDCISRYTKDARTIFALGVGIIMDIPNEEFGIILGQFKKNKFQTILFHRKNAFLYKLCISKIDLNLIFVEGDRVNFIAVSAPEGFLTEWIAVQVSIFSNTTISSVKQSLKEHQEIGAVGYDQDIFQ